MIWKLLVFGYCLLPVMGVSQDDFCKRSENKKVKKIYEKLYDRETKDKERYALLQESIKIDEYCTECYFDFARLAMYDAMDNMRPYTLAKEYFKKSIELCPTFSSDAYYQLARIATFEENSEDALLYIDLHNSFKSDNDKSYAKQFEDKKAKLAAYKPELIFWKEWDENTVPFDPEVVKNVSSEVDEYLPMLSPDNELIYFTRKEKIGRVNVGVTQTDKDFEEPLYVAYREDVLKDFDGGKRLPKPFEVDKFVGLGGVSISVDNHEMIICGCEMQKMDTNGDGVAGPGETYKNCDLFSTSFEKVYNMNSKKYEIKWSELKRLGDEINTSNGWEATPSLSSDGKTLYFAAIRAGSKDIDIFYSKRQEDGTWSRSRKVKGINSNGDDKAPFMHSDSKTMYFVSGPSKQAQMIAEGSGTDYVYEKAERSPGGSDIYYSKQKDGKWTKPVLMAKPINTQWDELGIIVSTDGHWAYFATNRLKGSGKTDVYRFELYEAAKPEKVMLVKGVVKKADGTPDSEAVIEVKKRGSDEKLVTKVNDDGKYAVIVNTEDKEDIIITTKKSGHMPSTKLITKETIAQNQEKHIPNVKLEDLSPAPIKKGAKFTVEDILYTTASADLSAHAQFVLDQFVAYLKENLSIKIEIQGHTDNEGIAAKNKVLSQKRAEAVKAYMTSKGIAGSRLSAVGFGQEQPKLPNTSASNKAKNRRTDFKILAI